MNAASVPYGDSCLTRLLADSMGHERSRAVLIATCRCVPHCAAAPLSKIAFFFTE